MFDAQTVPHRLDVALFALNRKKYDLEDSLDDEISEKIALAQQAAEGEVKIENLFKIDFVLG